MEMRLIEIKQPRAACFEGLSREAFHGRCQATAGMGLYPAGACVSREKRGADMDPDFARLGVLARLLRGVTACGGRVWCGRSGGVGWV